MNSKRMFYVLSGCLALLAALGIAGTVYGNTLLEKSAKSLNELKLQTNIIDEQHSSLAQAHRDIEKYAELEKIAKTIVPQEKDQARTVREIVKFAAETGVPITNITFPASDLGSAKAPAAPTSSGSQGTKSTPSPISQAKPVEGIKGVYQLEVSIKNDKDSPVRYQSILNFLKKLEQNRRTSQVTNVTLNPDPKNRNMLTYSMTINAYIKP